MIRWEWGESADMKDKNIKVWKKPHVFRKKFFKPDGQRKKKG